MTAFAKGRERTLKKGTTAAAPVQGRVDIEGVNLTVKPECAVSRRTEARHSDNAIGPTVRHEHDLASTRSNSRSPPRGLATKRHCTKQTVRQNPGVRIVPRIDIDARYLGGVFGACLSDGNDELVHRSMLYRQSKLGKRPWSFICIKFDCRHRRPATQGAAGRACREISLRSCCIATALSEGFVSCA